MVRLVGAFGARGVPAHPLRPAELVERLDAAPPAAVLLRVPSGGPRDALDPLLAPARDGRPATWIDPPASVARAHDKAALARRLVEAGLPTPPTALVTRDDPHAADELPGERLVVKPPTGSAGRGVTLGLPRDAALRGARAYAELTGAALVQTRLDGTVDRRVLLVGGEVVAAMERRPGATGRGSVHYGGSPRAWSPDPGQAELARAAARAAGLEVAGVDLLEDAGRDVVLEVNTCPGFAAIERATGADVAGALADLVLRRAGVGPRRAGRLTPRSAGGSGVR